MKRTLKATLGRRSWTIKRVRKLREDYACCYPDAREIQIEEEHDGAFLLNLLIHEALHAVWPARLMRVMPPEKAEEEEERWVSRTARELATLIRKADLASEDCK